TAAGSARLQPSVVGPVFALACLTRYEAWLVTAAALPLAAWARRRRGDAWVAAVGDVGRIAVYPAAAIGLFLVFSRIVIGEWFVSSGFFVPENKAFGKPMLAAAEVWWGARMLGGGPLLLLALAGIVGLLAVAIIQRDRAHGVIALSLAAAGALPWSA